MARITSGCVPRRPGSAVVGPGAGGVWDQGEEMWRAAIYHRLRSTASKVATTFRSACVRGSDRSQFSAAPQRPQPRHCCAMRSDGWRWPRRFPLGWAATAARAGAPSRSPVLRCHGSERPQNPLHGELLLRGEARAGRARAGDNGCRVRRVDGSRSTR